jgi:hypothetical protein
MGAAKIKCAFSSLMGSAKKQKTVDDSVAELDAKDLEEAGEDSGATTPICTPFKLPGYAVSVGSLSKVDEKELKGQKIAYRFEDGWDVGTFRKKYKGKSAQYKGTYLVYFDSFKKNYYPKLELGEYGPTQSWCVVEKKT